MDDLEDLQASEFVTDTEDQDSLDEKIDAEQRLRNQQLWASFQNAACCITKLYKDRTQANVSPWDPFQHAASNLTTLYKDCIESQRRFARIGYQVGRRRQMRDFNWLIKKHKMQAKHQQQQQVLSTAQQTHGDHSSCINDSTTMVDYSGRSGSQQQQQQQHQHQHQHQQHNNNNNNVASILEVNQMNLGPQETVPSNSVSAQGLNQMHLQPQFQFQFQPQLQLQTQQQHQQGNSQILLGNNGSKKRSSSSASGNNIKRKCFYQV